MNTKANEAANLLVHYFKLARVVTHNDNRAEIRDIIRLTIEAAVAEAVAAVGGRDQRLN